MIAHAKLKAGIQGIRLYFCSLLKLDRKSTRLNSSHGYISYAVFCLKKKISASLLGLPMPASWIGTVHPTILVNSVVSIDESLRPCRCLPSVTSFSGAYATLDSQVQA